MGHLSLGQVNESCPDYHLHPKLCLKYVREIVYPSLKDKIDLESIFDKNLDNLAEHWNMKLKNYEWLLKHRILFDRRDYTSYEVKLPFYLKNLDN